MRYRPLVETMRAAHESGPEGAHSACATVTSDVPYVPRLLSVDSEKDQLCPLVVDCIDGAAAITSPVAGSLDEGTCGVNGNAEGEEVDDSEAVTVC